MPSFTNFTDILPDPSNKIGLAGQADVAGIAGPGFATVKLSSVELMMKSRVNSQRVTGFSASHHKWEIDINYNPMTCDIFHVVYVFLMQQKSSLLPFYVSLPQYANQSISNKTTSGNKLKGDNILLLTDTGVTPGTIFTILNEDKIYKITRVETENDYYEFAGSPGAGQERIHITPALQKDMDGGTNITFTDLKFWVVQQGDVIEYALNKNNLFSFSIKLEEYIDAYFF